MGFSKSPAAYSDCKRVLDLALKNPGLEYRLATYGDAMSFMQRCYAYRNLIHDLEKEKQLGVIGARSEVEYDIIRIRRPKNPDGSKGSTLIFEHRGIEGELVLPSGEKLDIADLAEEPETDNLDSIIPPDFSSLNLNLDED